MGVWSRIFKAVSCNKINNGMWWIAINTTGNMNYEADSRTSTVYWVWVEKPWLKSAFVPLKKYYR